MTSSINNRPSIREEQVAWTGDNIIGHSIDPETGQIDTTEGFGAFDDVLESNVCGPRILDIGGGAYDTNSSYVSHRYLLDCKVYDPYKRSEAHCKKVLSQAEKRPFSASFSLSVLNVISEPLARKEHIRLCQKVLKTGGKAFFKVWPGDHSGIGKPTASGYQNNREIDTYLEEIKQEWGKENVFFDEKTQTISCKNPIVKHKRGSYSL